MYVNVAVLTETRAHERRVALVPSVVQKLVKLGARLHMQPGAARRFIWMTPRSRTSPL
jgi:NAD/NADP transhydrogenase alpha subunit